MEEKKQMVEMTEQEMQEYLKMKEAKAKKEALDKNREDKKTLQEMVDNALPEVARVIQCCHITLAETREKIWGMFEPLMEMRKETNLSKAGERQDSFTFTKSDGSIKIKIGYNTLDDYLTGADDGIALVKEYLNGLANTPEAQELIAMVMELLAKDKAGNLKASRVLKLQQMAEKSGDDKFLAGMKLINDAYTSKRSSQYIVFMKRDEKSGKYEKVETKL